MAVVLQICPFSVNLCACTSPVWRNRWFLRWWRQCRCRPPPHRGYGTALCIRPAVRKSSFFSFSPPCPHWLQRRTKKRNFNARSVSDVTSPSALGWWRHRVALNRRHGWRQDQGPQPAQQTTQCSFRVRGVSQPAHPVDRGSSVIQLAPGSWAACWPPGDHVLCPWHAARWPSDFPAGTAHCKSARYYGWHCWERGRWRQACRGFEQTSTAKCP